MTVKLDIRSGSVNGFYTPICGSYSLYKQSCILSYQVKKWSWNINSHSKAKTTETLDLYQAHAHEGPGRQRFNFLFYNLLTKNLRPGRYFISCCQFFILWYFTNKTRPTHFLFYPYFFGPGPLIFHFIGPLFYLSFQVCNRTHRAYSILEKNEGEEKYSWNGVHKYVLTANFAAIFQIFLSLCTCMCHILIVYTLELKINFVTLTNPHQIVLVWYLANAQRLG